MYGILTFDWRKQLNCMYINFLHKERVRGKDSSGR
jgi:hypothetical protein